MANRLEHLLVSAASTRVEAPARAWLLDARRRAAEGPLTGLLTTYAEAALRFGRGPLGLDPIEQDAVSAVATGLRCERWTLDDAARALLLMARRDGGAAEATIVADTLACYERGDAREQQSWLKAIAIWPEAAALLPTAIDACRTNIIPVFEAIACENPYPARHFPERNFNQLVLKALFNGIGVARIVGLDGRLNPDLARMATDYAAERRAAGRPVPSDIALVTGTRPSQEPRT